MSPEQTRAARCALRAVLAAQPGGEGAERMMPAKADRAKTFRRVGPEIHYEVERHPGHGPLAVVHQVRAVSLIDGREWIHSERVERATFDQIVTLARSKRTRRPLEDVIATGAEHAAAHVRVLCHCRQVRPDEHVEAMAMAWVDHAARHAVVAGAWAGDAGHLGALVSADMAAEVNARAREIWGDMLWAVLP